jgi:hypothetical protein
MRDSQNQSISQRTEVLIDKLLLGRFTLAEIAKITGIPEQGLQNYLSVNSNLDYQQVPSSS